LIIVDIDTWIQSKSKFFIFRLLMMTKIMNYLIEKIIWGEKLRKTNSFLKCYIS